MIKPFYEEAHTGSINIRNMKAFLYVVFSLPDYEIENLIDYLDKDHNGFIPVKELEKEIEFAKE